jgi:hypothetical protein
MADGRIVESPPAVWLWRSGPNNASKSTESQMIEMAIDAHISGTRTSVQRVARVGSWEMAAMTHLLSHR